MRSEAHDVRIPVFCRVVMPRHAIAQLHKSMLNVARMFFVVQVFADLLVGERAPKPRAPPEQERHKHDEPGRKEKDQAIASSQTKGVFSRCNRVMKRSPGWRVRSRR